MGRYVHWRSGLLHISAGEPSGVWSTGDGRHMVTTLYVETTALWCRANDGRSGCRRGSRHREHAERKRNTGRASGRGPPSPLGGELLCGAPEDQHAKPPENKAEVAMHQTTQGGEEKVARGRAAGLEPSHAHCRSPSPSAFSVIERSLAVRLRRKRLPDLESIRVLSIFAPSAHPRLAGERPRRWQDCTTEACPPRPNKDMSEGNTGEELP